MSAMMKAARLGRRSGAAKSLALSKRGAVRDQPLGELRLRMRPARVDVHSKRLPDGGFPRATSRYDGSRQQIAEGAGL